MSFSVSSDSELSSSEDSYANWLESRKIARRALKASMKKTVTSSVPTDSVSSNSMPCIASDSGVSNGTAELEHQVERIPLYFQL